MEVLTYSREPDAAWLDVEVGEVIHQSGLEIVLDQVNNDSGTKENVLTVLHEFVRCESIRTQY